MILTIIGARPQFIKAAPVSAALREAGLVEEMLHTGQHFDHNMDRVFFDELGMPYPKRNLGVGGGSHAQQTARMLEGIEETIDALKPRVLLVYGDTNSTLAGALAASKRGIPIAHVEAGLRSHNLTMPEEINRKLTDHISRWLFCPSETAVQELANEGIHANVDVVGDVMLDAFIGFRGRAEQLALPQGLTKGNYLLFTLHRPYNTDDPKRIKAIIDALSEMPYSIYWPLHPRVANAINAYVLPNNIHTTTPLSYLQMMNTLINCRSLLTDSGGMQKEAYWAKVQCLTLRSETEWVETLKNNWNQLIKEVTPNTLLDGLNTKPEQWVPLYGNGDAAKKIAHKLKVFMDDFE